MPVWSFISQITPAGWSALAASAALVWTTFYQSMTLRREGRKRAVELILRMAERWDGTDNRVLRRRAAVYLLGGDVGVANPIPAVWDVLNLLEEVAYLHAQNAVSDYDVWHFFGAWIFPYYKACKGIIEKERVTNPSAFADLTATYAAICDVEKNRYPKKDIEFSEEDVRRTLEDEADGAVVTEEPNPPGATTPGYSCNQPGCTRVATDRQVG